MHLLFTHIFFWLNPWKPECLTALKTLHGFMKCTSIQTETRKTSVFYFHSSPVQAMLKTERSLNLSAFPIPSSQRKNITFSCLRMEKNSCSVCLTYWCYFPLIGEDFTQGAGKWILTGAVLKTCRKRSFWLKWIKQKSLLISSKRCIYLKDSKLWCGLCGSCRKL